MKLDLYNEDCMDVMARYPDNYFDICVTSPPYDNLRDYGDSFTAWGESKWCEIIELMFCKMAVGGVVVWIVSDATVDGSESGSSFKQALKFISSGFRLHDTMIWNKPNPVPRSHNRYEQGFEYMFVMSKSRPAVWRPLKEKAQGHGRKNCGTIQKTTNGKKSKKTGTDIVGEYKVKSNVWSHSSYSGSVDHPAPFPLELVLMHLSSWAPEGCKVFEPFLGSGTSGIAAYEFGASEFVGAELDADYFEAASARIERAMGQGKLF